MDLIEIKNLSKCYGSTKVMENLNLSISAGQIVGLVGPNGCGKTTLLKILAGTIADYTGEILLDGEPIGPSSKAKVSYLPENTYLPSWMRPVDAYDLFSDFYDDFDAAKAKAMLKAFNVDKRQRIRTMSKGMQEKLQLSLVMGRQAKIYLLDEPMGGVDPASRSAIVESTIRQYQEDALMIFATHLIGDVETIFDRVIFMGFNEIKIDGEAEELRQTYHKSIDGIFREVFACLADY